MTRIAFMLILGLATPAWADGGVQIVGDAAGGFCECPVWEDGRTCDDLRVELPEYRGTCVGRLFLNGLTDVREVRFGLLFDPPHDLLGWGVCRDGFIDSVTDTVPGPELEVRMTAFGGCHTIADGFHFMICLDFLAGFEQPTTVSVVPDPSLGVVQVTDCDGRILTVDGDALVRFGYGGVPGYDPCKDVMDVPIDELSWGRVKSRY